MAEVRSVSSTGAEKGVKPWRYDLLPPLPLVELARLYGRGAQKYADHNFRRGFEWSKSYAALQRHINLFWSGEDIDQEMNLNHLSSVAWHLIVLMEFSEIFPMFDDRNGKPVGDPPSFEKNPTVDASAEDWETDRHGLHQPRFDLIPLNPLAALSDLYGRLGPVQHPVRWSSLYTAAQEHLFMFWAGEDTDTHGDSRLAHALRYVLELHQAYIFHKEADDRYLKGAAPIGFDSNPK